LQLWRTGRRCRPRHPSSKKVSGPWCREPRGRLKVSADDDPWLAEAAEADARATLRAGGARAADRRAAGRGRRAAPGRAGAAAAARVAGARAADRRARRLAHVRRRIADAAAALRVGGAGGGLAPAGLAAEAAALPIDRLVVD